jgi:hypothetical protein
VTAESAELANQVEQMTLAEQEQVPVEESKDESRAATVGKKKNKSKSKAKQA